MRHRTMRKAAIDAVPHAQTPAPAQIVTICDQIMLHFDLYSFAPQTKFNLFGAFLALMPFLGVSSL